MKRRDFLTTTLAATIAPRVLVNAANATVPGRVIAPEPDVIVRNNHELNNALANADGVTIGCTPGNYGNLQFNRNPRKTVTITSTDKDRPAIFTSMLVEQASNLVINRARLQYTFARGHEEWHKAFEIRNSESCVIANCAIVGEDGPSGYGFAEGLFVRWSNRTSVAANKFTGFTRCLHINESGNSHVWGNEFSRMRGDAITLPNATPNTLIEFNEIHDFRSSGTDGYHRDGLEFWSDNGNPLLGLTVRHNTFNIGNGPWFQSIFGRNTRNAVFEGNSIRNFHTHGITPGADSKNVLVNNNILVMHANMNVAANREIEAIGAHVPEIYMNFTPGPCTITNNRTPKRIHIKPGWVASNNTFG